MKYKISKFLAFILILQSSIIPSYAFSQNISTPKEEVVYGILNNSGEVTEVYIVNSFSGGEVTDYGNYSKVKNLNTTDEIHQNGDEITFSSESDKVYYQGTLENSELPWNFEIKYFLNGEEKTAEEIAGQEGNLQIQILINKNETFDPSFFESYALQITLTLDENNCQNIIAEGATIANVGETKQLTYTILPNKSSEINIYSDIKDFEMDQININGVRLNLNIDINNDVISDKVQEIQDAVYTLNNGTGEVNDAMIKLTQGFTSIYSALEKLNQNSDSLRSGSKNVYNALTSIKEKLEISTTDTEKIGLLANSSNQIKSGIDSLKSGLESIETNINNYYSALSQAGIASIDEYINNHQNLLNNLGISDFQLAIYKSYSTSGLEAAIITIQEYAKSQNQEANDLLSKYKDGNTQVIQSFIEQSGKLIQIQKILQADMQYITNSNKLISGIQDVLNSETGEIGSGSSNLQKNYTVFNQNIQDLSTMLTSITESMLTLKQAISTLVENYATLDTGINSYTGAVAEIIVGYNKLYDGILNLADALDKIHSGTEEFYEKTEDIDSEVNDTITDTVENMTGKNTKIISFASEKNTEVESVLFLIKSPAIKKISEDKVVQEVEEKLTIWQKFLKIFGLY